MNWSSESSKEGLIPWILKTSWLVFKYLKIQNISIIHLSNTYVICWSLELVLKFQLMHKAEGKTEKLIWFYNFLFELTGCVLLKWWWVIEWKTPFQTCIYIEFSKLYLAFRLNITCLNSHVVIAWVFPGIYINEMVFLFRILVGFFQQNLLFISNEIFTQIRIF